MKLKTEKAYREAVAKAYNSSNTDKPIKLYFITFRKGVKLGKTPMYGYHLVIFAYSRKQALSYLYQVFVGIEKAKHSFRCTTNVEHIRSKVRHYSYDATNLILTNTK